MIYVVRHGQDTYNLASLLNGRTDTELTQLGREQASRTADRLMGKGIARIYTSPLKRANQTAWIIAEKLGLTSVISLPDLIERDFGILTGKPVADIPKYASDLMQTDRVTYFLQAEGAETFPQVHARAKNAFDHIRERHNNENVLIVTHGDLGKMMRAVNEGWTWEQGLRAPYFDNAQVLELSDKVVAK